MSNVTYFITFDIKQIIIVEKRYEFYMCAIISFGFAFNLIFGGCGLRYKVKFFL